MRKASKKGGKPDDQFYTNLEEKWNFYWKFMNNTQGYS